jgi:hypothetical protein
MAAGETSPVGDSGAQPADASSQAGDARACAYPAGVTVSSPSGPGCFGGPAGQICAVSNGAFIGPDGGLISGTESCSSLCAPSEFEMTCADTNMSPDPSLDCTVIPIPTPEGRLYYCCACAAE